MKPLNISADAPWKARYRAPSIAWAVLAQANPKRGLVASNLDGIIQLYAWDVPTGKLTKLTNKPTGVVIGTISPDGGYVYYLDDEGGNEIGHFVRVPFEGGDAQDVTPDMPLYASHNLRHSRNGNAMAFTTANAGFKVYVQRGREDYAVVFTSERLTRAPSLSADGQIVAVESSERSGTVDTSIYAFDTETGEQIAELYYPNASAHQYDRFSPIDGDSRLLATTTAPGYERPLIWNPQTGDIRELKVDDIPGDIFPWDWSPDASKVLLCQLYQAQHSLYLYDLDDDHVGKLTPPAGVVGGGYFTPDGDIFATWQDASHPSELVALDGRTGEKKRTVLQAGSAPAGINWRSVSFAGANGEEIQAWLATPDGDGPFPTILHTHGGPTSVATASYHPSSQAWLDHGFAFFSINYHGSTTFGRDFEHSIWHNLGDLEVQDIVAAYHWLVDEGIAQPDAVLLTGGSYGGYLTLQTIGKEPDYWAGGMAQVAIGDWKLMYEDQAETLRGYQRALFGGTPAETPEATRKSSPITYAEQIKAPLLVIQGSNDTRCPARQMRAYEDRLKSFGKEIKVHWFDAGHGSRAMEQQIEHQEMMLHFAYQVLG
ncbi:MAG: prolyl oligopeptidase family serine peptidase [Anaerolineae bacterium]|nr:prolyl oligopeptidase family serine peptidase [Anaerolineae bacterium]